jgi:hypothetical protein
VVFKQLFFWTRTTDMLVLNPQSASLFGVILRTRVRLAMFA